MAGPGLPVGPEQRPPAQMRGQGQQAALAPEIVALTLFESGHEGYGDSRAIARPHRYHRVLRGFDLSVPGEMRFGHFITRVAHAVPLGQPPVWAGEWLDTDSATPAVFYVSGRHVMKLQGGASTEIAAAGPPALAQIATSAALHDDGSGTPLLYFGQGFAASIQRMTVAQVVSTGTRVHDKLASIAGYLYGSVIPSGGTGFSAISFVTPGADPFTAANWSPSIVVGWPTTDINEIKQVRGIPVILKPEGLFLYSRRLDLWENKMPAWEAMPHPDNGRGAFSLGLALVVPVGRGGAVIFDGYTIRDFSPFDKEAIPNLDTTQQAFSVISATPYGLLAVTRVGRGPSGGQGSKHAHDLSFGSTINAKVTRRGGSDDDGSGILGARFFKTVDNEANFTDYTTEVNDGSWTTYADLGSLSTAAAGDYFYIGHPRPFQGVQLYINAANANASTLSAEIWNGSAWVAITISDLTVDDSAAAVTLSSANMVIFTQDPTQLSWARRTLGADSQSNYYVRFQVSATLDATTRVAQLGLLPWRPAIDVTNFPEDGMDRAGCFPHLLLCDPTEKGGGRWHDLGALMTTMTSVDEVSCLLTAEVGGSYGNATNKTVGIGKNACFLIEGGLTDNWPFIAPAGLAEFGFVQPASGRSVRLREVRLWGEDFDGLSNMFFYWRYSPLERWSRRALGIRPHARVPIGQATNGGPEFQWALGYLMSLDTVARRPKGIRVEADFEVLMGPANRQSERAVANPPRG